MNLKTLFMVLIIIGAKRPPRKKLFKYFDTNRKTIALISIGLLFVLIGLTAHFIFPSILKLAIQNVLNLNPDGEFYQWWTTPNPTPTQVGFNFFHIENPYDFEMGNHQKLKVKEQGTYIFKQFIEKKIVGFSPNKDSLIYYDKKTYHFDEDASTGSLDDNITVINAPLAAIGSLVPQYLMSVPINFFVRSLAYRFVNRFIESHNQSLFINTTIRNLIYGYHIDMLDSAQNTIKSLEKVGLYNLIPTYAFPNNSFGILLGRNGSYDGPYEMYTGLAGTKDLFGYYKSWNNQTKLNWWKDDKCNAINGTDGTLWPPFINKKDRLYFYVPDLCRSLYMVYDKESQYKGIHTSLYTASDDMLAGYEKNPENKCFCMDQNDENCKLNGVFNLSPCQSDIPIIVSLPHFLGADSNTTARFEGLKPDPLIHRPVVHMEPTMGTILYGDAKIQMSIRIDKNPYLSGFSDLHSQTDVPLFWVYKKLGVSDEFAEVIKSRLFRPVYVIHVAIYSTLALGTFTLIIVVVKSFLCKKQELTIRLNSYQDIKLPPLNSSNWISRTNEWEFDYLMKSESSRETIV